MVGAFDGSRQRAPMYNLANTYTLRTDAHCALANTLTGTEHEALPVPVVLRLNRGGRKSRRAICNCSRCAAAPQASRLIIFPTGVLRLALKDEGAGFTGKRELSN